MKLLMKFYVCSFKVLNHKKKSHLDIDKNLNPYIELSYK